MNTKNTLRTNLEALHLSTKQPTHQPTHQPPKEAPKPAKKPRPGKNTGRAPKKGATPARATSKTEGGDSGDGDGGDPGDGDAGDGDPGDGEFAPITSAHELALARILPEIVALPLDQVRHITVHVPAASMLALGALPKMLAFREAMAAEFTPSLLTTLDKLRDYALAAARAHARVLPRDEGETDVRALLNEAGPLRERLLLNAASLASFGLLDAKQVDAIRRGSGHLDTTQALSALGLLYADAWPALASKTPLARADVERAIELGGLLLEALGRRNQGTDGSGNPAEAEEQLGKAFELFRRAYERCRYAIIYLRRNEGDADDIAPPLAHSRRRGRAAPADEPGGDEPDGSDEPGGNEPDDTDEPDEGESGGTDGPDGGEPGGKAGGVTTV